MRACTCLGSCVRILSFCVDKRLCVLEAWVMRHAISLLSIGLLSISSVTSTLLQPHSFNSTDLDLLNIDVPESDITTLQTPSSLDLSWPSQTEHFNLSNISSHPATILGSPSNKTGLQSPTVLVKCDGRKYGWDLSIPSCEEAWSFLPKTSTPRTCERPKPYKNQS